MTTIPTTIQEHVPLPASGGAPPAAARAITPGDIVAMLKQRLITIIALSLLFGAVGVGLFFLAYVKFPRYAADALIECISDAPARPLSVEQLKMADDPYARFVRSQALFIKSYPILSAVLKDPVVRATNWFRNEVDTGEHLLELEERLGCSPIRETNYIRVAISTRSPQDPHKIVNTVVDIYLARVRERASAQYRQELTDYKREFAEVREQITKKQEQIRQFAATLPPGEVAGKPEQLGQGMTIKQLEQDHETVAELQLQTDELQSLMDIYANPEGLAVDPADRLQVEQDQKVAMLDSQVFALEQELSILLKQFGPEHREHREMKIRLDEVVQQLDATRANKLREVLEFKRQQVETAFYNSQNALMLARERLQATQAQQADLERKLSEYRTLLEELDLLILIQNRIDEYIREIQRIVQERNAIRVQQAVGASEPLQRSFPSLYLLPVIIIAAFALAVGLALGLELIDTSVKTTQDIVRHLHVAMLGSIPDVDDEEIHIEHVESAVREAPHSMVTEAFRTIRGNLQFSAPAERMRSILVTSPKPEDGRTTVASNLAASLAIGGRRVLLVDANLRRPALHRVYPQVGTRGLTNILIGEARVADGVQHTDLANLDVIGSGPIPPNPAELLGSELCRKFITEVTEAYDHVVVDSPPVLLASDASVLATLVDGTILVCRAKDNTRGVALRAISLLTHVNARIFGAVLNVAQARRGGYFREQLRTFYEYQSEEELSEAGPRALPEQSKEEKDSSGADEPADGDED